MRFILALGVVLAANSTVQAAHLDVPQVQRATFTVHTITQGLSHPWSLTLASRWPHAGNKAL